MSDTNINNNKKQKMMEYPQAPDSEWPEAWLMTESEVEDQCLPNKQTPNVPVDAAGMRQLGINYWKLDAAAYEYPIKAIPWDPADAADPKLQALRDDRGYNYADIITIHPDHLPEFDKKIAAFFEEHIHDAEEIRYILAGSGYFDVRDLNDKWVRIHIKAGDLMTLPEGIYHRFTCDETRYIHAMRLFIVRMCRTTMLMCVCVCERISSPLTMMLYCHLLSISLYTGTTGLDAVFSQ